MRDKRELFIDGKLVRNYLFAYLVTNIGDGSRVPAMVQVEAFDKDHAMTRLLLAYPRVPRKAWHFIEELDPEHDVGKLGARLPLHPNAVKSDSTVRH